MNYQKGDKRFGFPPGGVPAISKFILVAAIAAIALRLPHLEQRPMHGDEAVHAFKFSELLEKGSYRYNPNEYHGPTLNYLTLIPAWLSSDQKLSDLSELALRIVPVFFGVLLVLLLLLLADGLGTPAVIIAALLTAISPAFVFYSRYYIHEMLLVCFSFGVVACSYRYTQSKKIWWALLTGMFLALCHATKETCIIAFGAILLALLFTLLMRRRQGSISNTLKAGFPAPKTTERSSFGAGVPLIPADSGQRTADSKKLNAERYTLPYPRHLFAAVAAALIISALFYSSFLTNPGGILDSFSAYVSYFSRAGQNQLHIHPWYYYLKMLIYFRWFPQSGVPAAGPVWSEALIVLLAVIGFAAAMTRKGITNVNFHLLRFIAFYTAVMTIVYSVIPYKTPWCLLGFLHGMILLAAVGAVAVIKLAPNVTARVVISLLLIVGGAHLAWQGYLGSFKYYANPANPYVYAHTSTDVINIAQKIEELSQVHPDGRDMYIYVICPENDSWPFPWYLRNFTNVGFWNTVDKSVSAVPIIITFPRIESDLCKYIDLAASGLGNKNSYVPLFNLYKELRPQVELRCYVKKWLKDSYEQHQVQLILSQSKNKK